MRFLSVITLLFLSICLKPSHVFAQDILIKKINFDKNKNLKISLTNKAKFKTYTLSNPERLVLDIDDAALDLDGVSLDFPSFVSGMRKNKQENFLRLVFDLKEKISIKRASFQKTKNDALGTIIIVTESGTKGIKSASLDEFIESKTNTKYIIKEEAGKDIANKIPIIVIDAGHGGKDPGTIGDYARTKEKNVTLAYAKELAKHLRNTQNYKVYLTRDSDEFIPLKGRVEKARKLNADLFISLHANAASDHNASGLSVYTLSEKSSDKQAELLAQKENHADILAGVNFGNTSGDVLTTLINLSQRDSMNNSSRFANITIKSVQQLDVEILHNTHRFAGFVVLTAPDVASILVELGYLSNRQEEEKLNSLGYKRNIVKGLADAIDEYFKMK